MAAPNFFHDNASSQAEPEYNSENKNSVEYTIWSTFFRSIFFSTDLNFQYYTHSTWYSTHILSTKPNKSSSKTTLSRTSVPNSYVR